MMEVIVKGTHKEIVALILALQEQKEQEETNSDFDENREAYLAWKEKLARTGRTPSDAIAQFRANGMNEYADQVERFILRINQGEQLNL